MPYRALFLMRDIMFRTNYARDARLSAAKVRQFAHFFALVLAQPRSLQESARGIVRLCLGQAMRWRWGSRVVNCWLTSRA